MEDTQDSQLAELLAKAVPRPAFLATSNGGAVLSLALHCLMIESGFVLNDESGTRPETRYLPHKDWNGLYLDQWIFEYRRPGKANLFTLHCSLQARTKRMFIQATEENNPSNVCVLGLQLDNYVPEAAPLRSGWASGVVKNVAKMRALFTEYVLQPLMANAEDEQQPPPAEAAADGEAPAAAAPPLAAGRWAWLVGGGAATAAEQAAARRRLALAALGAAAVAVTAVVVAQRLRQRSA